MMIIVEILVSTKGLKEINFPDTVFSVHDNDAAVKSDIMW